MISDVVNPFMESIPKASKIKFIPCQDHYLSERYLIPDATKYDQETGKERRY